MLRNKFQSGLLFVLLFSFLIISCNKSADIKPEPIDFSGTYKGKVIYNPQGSEFSATCFVEILDAGNVKINCVSESIDTTYFFECYQDGSILRLCHTEYGYGGWSGNSGQCGNYTGQNNGQTPSWLEHMNGCQSQENNHPGCYYQQSAKFECVIMEDDIDGQSIIFEGYKL